jgi:EthD domain
MAGVTTVALLERRTDISRDLFSRYWRDVHGVMAARIPGFDSYVQNHVIPVAGLGEIAIEPFEGIAVCGFLSAEDRIGLTESEITSHIHRDEQNVFRRALLYNLDEGASHTLVPGSGAARVFLVIPEGGDPQELIGILVEHTPAALVFHDLSSGDPSGWNDADVDDGGTGRLFLALIEVAFENDDLARAAIDAVRARSKDAGAYLVGARYPMVENGKITIVGLRGLDAALTIAEANATNQLEDETIRAIYGVGNR